MTQLPVPTLVTHFPNYCGFILRINIWLYTSSVFVISQVMLTILSPLHFHIYSTVSLSVSTPRKTCSFFLFVIEVTVNQFGDKWHFHILEASNLQIWYVPPLTWIFLLILFYSLGHIVLCVCFHCNVHDISYPIFNFFMLLFNLYVVDIM